MCCTAAHEHLQDVPAPLYGDAGKKSPTHTTVHDNTALQTGSVLTISLLQWAPASQAGQISLLVLQLLMVLHIQRL